LNEGATLKRPRKASLSDALPEQWSTLISYGLCAVWSNLPAANSLTLPRVESPAASGPECASLPSIRFQPPAAPSTQWPLL